VERWKEIELRGYKMLISDRGQVRLPAKSTTFSAIRLGKPMTQTCTFKERTLKPTKTIHGYLEVKFVHQRKTFKFLVHRLVATAFVDGAGDGMVVNHMDGNKLNNAPENLEWVTPGRNSEHAWEIKKIPIRGIQNANAKFTEQQIRHIRKALARGFPANSLAIIAGVSTAAILKIRDRKTWAHI
jgi:hypothetical protein